MLMRGYRTLVHIVASPEYGKRQAFNKYFKFKPSLYIETLLWPQVAQMNPEEAAAGPQFIKAVKPAG